MSRYTIKPNGRIKRTADQRFALAKEALRVASMYQPVTLRQLFYVLVNTGWLAKIEPEYKNLGNLVTKMRRGLYPGIHMSWDLIADAGRYNRQVAMWSDGPEALQSLVNQYRRDVWQDQEIRIYLGVEKEALAAVFQSVADEYGVPVVVSRGYPSATYLHDLEVAFGYHQRNGKEVHFFYYGDHDPSGDGISDLFQYGSPEVIGLPCVFHRTALTADQILEQDILTRPPKTSDSRTANWNDGGAEVADVDAIPPDDLRKLIRQDIESVLDLEMFKYTLGKQKTDINRLKTVADKWDELELD